jgi:biopolymer transport protein ExbD
MKIKRNRQAKKGRIEIIPMIDVMFFLLATFIIASLSMQKIDALKVDLTQGKADKSQVEDKIAFTITHNGEVFLQKELISLDEIYARITNLNNQQKQLVVISCDKEAKQGIMMEVMLRAKAAGVLNFSIVTNSK